MKQSLRKQLFAGLRLEQAEVDIDPTLTAVTEDDLEETTEGESSVAEAIEDVELDTEVNDIENEGEDLDDAAETLNELDVAVESYVASGKSLSKIEVLALTATVKQVTGKYVKDSSMVVPAIESFNSHDGIDQTKLAHEGIKEAAKSFGDASVAAVKKAFERLKEIISNFIKRFRGINARADKIIVAAKAIKTDITGDVAINKDNLSVDGQLDYEAIKDAANRLTEVADKLKEEHKSQEALDSISKLSGAEKINAEDIFREQNSFMDKSFRNVFGEAKEEEGKLVSKAFPGEYHAVLHKGSGKEDDIHLSYEAFERRKPEEKGGEGKLQALQPTEIIALAGTVKALQGKVKAYDGLIKRFAESLVRLNSAHSRNPDNVTNHKEYKETAGKDKLKAVQKAVSRAFKQQMVFFSNFVSGTNNISHELLTWCEKSIALAGKEAKGETEDDKSSETKAEDKAE